MNNNATIDIIHMAMRSIKETCTTHCNDPESQGCHNCPINEFCQTFLGHSNDPALWPTDAISLILKKELSIG